MITLGFPLKVNIVVVESNLFVHEIVEANRLRSFENCLKGEEVGKWLKPVHHSKVPNEII